MIRYTATDAHGNYPDGSYNQSMLWRHLVVHQLKDAHLWQYKKYAQKWADKYGGQLVTVRVTREIVPDEV